MSADPGADVWSCATCGADHKGLATVFGPPAPDSWAAASEKERRQGEIDADTCTIHLDGQELFFIRGHIEIPVHDAPFDFFTWSAWVSLSATSMDTTIEHWDDPQRDQLPPMFGWLNNELPPYDESTLSLPTHVHTQAPGLVPLIELDPGIDHPLIREQLEGISAHRVAELNRLLLGH
ncbi:DUF2199 domain-containing protein [Nocardioides sp.]|uniref:DUF2199 domain-containing protein n=1 Tax=Nocardioides sp. TaxID=35761 RepID=UPI002732C203|nr:DUF2199 domain-containing protein [Nocardioides sp.]MDP3893301.1 DUF2199 domain-containing protein [Nocardioides sp.]